MKIFWLFNLLLCCSSCYAVGHAYDVKKLKSWATHCLLFASTWHLTFLMCVLCRPKKVKECCYNSVLILDQVKVWTVTVGTRGPAVYKKVTLRGDRLPAQTSPPYKPPLFVMVKWHYLEGIFVRWSLPCLEPRNYFFFQMTGSDVWDWPPLQSTSGRIH